MSKVALILFVLAVVCLLDAIDSEICKTTPPEKHCLIEHTVKYRWPHKVRYVYNWHMKNCFEIRWSNHCPSVPHPPVSNNFPTEQSCMDECGGWA